ncbi:MAG: FAD/NAD(P)-binding protein [Deltaproteobacteria bacterium]|nr:FAD/NAD(P)-binding protein [Deltaproteobacteria bacterium]
MPEKSGSGSFIEKEISYLPKLARVVQSRRMTDTEVMVRLEPGFVQPSFDYTPGQFVQEAVLGAGEAPLSICSTPTQKNGFDLCVRAAGTLTRAIHHLSPGDWVGIRGPYGRGFPISEMKKKDLLVVAAGLGIAPLRSLITYTLETRRDDRRLTVVYGTRKEKDILFREEVDAWGGNEAMDLYLTLSRAEESWKGRKGRPTEPLREIDIDPEKTVAAVAGPPAIYRYVGMELFEKGMDPKNIFCTLERHFQCGIGKCGHCQLNDLYVCRQGPVFSYSELVGRTEAIEAWAPEDRED